ncbi:hypothetical protein C4546_04445 [Candidatus Parcubacteria bacterium]|jgi:hypothetical protein|nr:MAG: hypothetical protein C4546_04445 [Candidatus Parcubacteria bacterium]
MANPDVELKKFCQEINQILAKAKPEERQNSILDLYRTYAKREENSKIVPDLTTITCRCVSADCIILEAIEKPQIPDELIERFFFEAVGGLETEELRKAFKLLKLYRYKAFDSVVNKYLILKDQEEFFGDLIKPHSRA